MKRTLIILVLSLMLFSGCNKIPTEASFDFIKPQWGRLECESEDASSYYPTQSGRKITDTNEFEILCGDTEYTDECDIIVKSTDVGAITDYFIYCVTNKGSDCDPNIRQEFYNNEQRTITTISKDQKVIAEAQDSLNPFGKPDGLYWLKKFKRWKIFRYEGSLKTTAVADSCYIHSTTGTGVTSGIPKQQFYNPLTFVGGEGMKWTHYVYDWIPTTGFQVYTHPQHGEVYCSGGKIYSLTTVTLEDGRVKKIDPASNEPADNNQLNFQSYGSFLANVECCPFEPLCCDDFTRRCGDDNKCSLDIECMNGGVPIAQSCTEMKRQKCISEKCEWQEVENVECTADHCCNPNEVCNLLNYECIESGSVNWYCGDGTCNRDESKITCPQDCGYPDDKDNWLMWILIALGVILIILVIIAIVVSNKKSKRRRSYSRKRPKPQQINIVVKK